MAQKKAVVAEESVKEMPKEEPKEAAQEVKEDKEILVQAVGRVGYYDDVRRYPEGHPKSRPFVVKESEYSDHTKPILVKRKDGSLMRIGLTGWMKKLRDAMPEEIREAKKQKLTPDAEFKRASAEVSGVQGVI